MKKSTKTLLLIGAAIGGVVLYKKHVAKKRAVLAATQAPALATASAATPATVVPDSALAGSSLSGTTIGADTIFG